MWIHGKGFTEGELSGKDSEGSWIRQGNQLGKGEAEDINWNPASF